MVSCFIRIVFLVTDPVGKTTILFVNGFKYNVFTLLGFTIGCSYKEGALTTVELTSSAGWLMGAVLWLVLPNDFVTTQNKNLVYNRFIGMVLGVLISIASLLTFKKTKLVSYK